MTVKKTSLFPASREVVFRKLQKLETLQTIAKPFATFEPIGESVSTWEVGSTSAYRFRLFGVIPFGKHTIHILRFEPEGFSSHEGKEHVPVWNHDRLPNHRAIFSFEETVTVSVIRQAEQYV